MMNTVRVEEFEESAKVVAVGINDLVAAINARRGRKNQKKKFTLLPKGSAYLGYEAAQTLRKYILANIVSPNSEQIFLFAVVGAAITDLAQVRHCKDALDFIFNRKGMEYYCYMSGTDPDYVRLKVADAITVSLNTVSPTLPRCVAV